MVTMNIWTAIPSHALPSDGRTFGMSVTDTAAGRTQGAFRGTSAWRPPIC